MHKIQTICTSLLKPQPTKSIALMPWSAFDHVYLTRMLRLILSQIKCEYVTISYIWRYSHLQLFLVGTVCEEILLECTGSQENRYSMLYNLHIITQWWQGQTVLDVARWNHLFQFITLDQEKSMCRVIMSTMPQQQHKGMTRSNAKWFYQKHSSVYHCLGLVQLKTLLPSSECLQMLFAGWICVNSYG